MDDVKGEDVPVISVASLMRKLQRVSEGLLAISEESVEIRTFRPHGLIDTKIIESIVK